MTDAEAENQQLRAKVEELEQAVTHLEEKVETLAKEKQQLQERIDSLQSNQIDRPTHRNILYGEEKHQKRLPTFKDPARGAERVGSLVFGECFAVGGERKKGQDLWLQLRGGDHAEQWVLGCDAGTVNCVDMARYDSEKYPMRIRSSEHRGQDFPRKMYTEGFPGSHTNNICLISASGDSFWREINIEMLLRGIATATVFEEAWGGDHTFTDWVAYYAVNCVQYGQLRTHSQKRLLVTVKPTSKWRGYQAGGCRGPELDKVRDDIGKAQYKECSWLKGMRHQLHVRWEEVEFLTAFAFLRAHCAWSADDCRRAANERFLWVLEEFFGGGYKQKALHELELAHWLWDEAFDGCAFDEAARASTYTDLKRVAGWGGWGLKIPGSVRAVSAAPLAWAELAAMAAAAVTTAVVAA